MGTESEVLKQGTEPTAAPEAPKAPEPVAKPQQQVETPKLVAVDSPEFRKAVEAVSFQQKDRELRPLREKLARYEKSEQQRLDEEAVQKQEAAETEQWETEGASTGVIKGFHDSRRDIQRAARELRENLDKYNTDITVSEIVTAWMPAVKDKIAPIVQSINERAKTPEHREDLIRAKMGEITTILAEEAKRMLGVTINSPAEVKPPVTPPKVPTGIPSAPGGNPDDAIVENFMKHPYDVQSQKDMTALERRRKNKGR